MSPFEIPRHPIWSEADQRLRETAYHEAGHAVLAKVTGTRHIGAISAHATGGVFECEFDPRLQAARDLDGRIVDLKREDAVILAGGSVAQARYMGENGIGLNPDGEWTAHADQHVFNCARGDYDAVVASIGKMQWVELCGIAKQWFDQPRIWTAVVALAEALIRKGGSLSDVAVDDVLHQVWLEYDLPEAEPLL